ncbi:MAG: hypothetical protein RR238_09370 [Lachnospiraceae bacterium]
MTKKYEVLEDNGGGLHLTVFNKKGNVEYIHSGYEYIKGQLREDIKALLDESIPVEDWEGNCGGLDWEYGTDPQALYDGLTSDEYGCKIVADNDGIYSEKMGCAARIEFDIEDEEDEEEF